MPKIGHQLSIGTLPINLARDLKKDHLSNSLIKEHNYDTCHKHDLYLPKAKGKTYRDVFWNKITCPEVLNQSKTYQCLSDCVKKNFLVNSIIESIKVSVITLKNILHYMYSHIPSYNANHS